MVCSLFYGNCGLHLAFEIRIFSTIAETYYPISSVNETLLMSYLDPEIFRRFVAPVLDIIRHQFNTAVTETDGKILRLPHHQRNMSHWVNTLVMWKTAKIFAKKWIEYSLLALHGITNCWFTYCYCDCECLSHQMGCLKFSVSVEIVGLQQHCNWHHREWFFYLFFAIVTAMQSNRNLSRNVWTRLKILSPRCSVTEILLSLLISVIGSFLWMWQCW